MFRFAERPRSGGTRKRLCPKRESKSSAPLQRIVRICVSLRFAILQRCDLAARSSQVKRTAGVRLRWSHSHGKFFVITILNQTANISSRSMLHDLKHSMPSSLINSHLPHLVEWPGFNTVCVLRFNRRVKRSINQTRWLPQHRMAKSAIHFPSRC